MSSGLTGGAALSGAVAMAVAMWRGWLEVAVAAAFSLTLGLGTGVSSSSVDNRASAAYKHLIHNHI